VREGETMLAPIENPHVVRAVTTKQANVYAWGWQLNARFRDPVRGRHFGKTYLGAALVGEAGEDAAAARGGCAGVELVLDGSLGRVG
jgi:hypothetical protein